MSRDAFERALAAFLSWRDDARSRLERALLESPHFAMAHVLSAYMSAWSRDVNRVRQARLAYASLSRLPVTTRELPLLLRMTRDCAFGPEYAVMKAENHSL